jgi:flagellar biosynthesis protein
MPDPPPRRRATALHYGHGDVAPTVTEAGVPVREDPALVEALAALDLGAHVPEALWTAVAETLAWAYRLDAGATRRHG